MTPIDKEFYKVINESNDFKGVFANESELEQTILKNPKEFHTTLQESEEFKDLFKDENEMLNTAGLKKKYFSEVSSQKSTTGTDVVSQFGESIGGLIKPSSKSRLKSLDYKSESDSNWFDLSDVKSRSEVAGWKIKEVEDKKKIGLHPYIKQGEDKSDITYFKPSQVPEGYTDISTTYEDIIVNTPKAQTEEQKKAATEFEKRMNLGKYQNPFVSNIRKLEAESSKKFNEASVIPNEATKTESEFGVQYDIKVPDDKYETVFGLPKWLNKSQQLYEASPNERNLFYTQSDDILGVGIDYWSQVSPEKVPNSVLGRFSPSNVFESNSGVNKVAADYLKHLQQTNKESYNIYKKIIDFQGNKIDYDDVYTYSSEYNKYLPNEEWSQLLPYLQQTNDGNFILQKPNDGIQVSFLNNALEHQKSIVMYDYISKGENATKEDYQKLKDSMNRLGEIADDIMGTKRYKEVIDKSIALDESAKRKQKVADEVYNEYYRKDPIAAFMYYNIGRPIKQSVVSTVAGAFSIPNMVGLGDALPEFSTKAKEAREIINNDVDPTALQGSIFEGNFKAVLPQLTRIVADMVTMGAGGRVLGGGKLTNIAVGMTNQYSNYYTPAFNEAINKGYSEKEANKIANTNGLAAGFLTSLVESFNLNLEKSLSGAVLKREITDNTIKVLARGGTLKDVLGEGWKFIKREMPKEQLEEFTNMVTDKWVNTITNEGYGLELDASFNATEIGETLLYTTLISGLGAFRQGVNMNNLQKAYLYDALTDPENFNIKMKGLLNKGQISGADVGNINQQLDEVKKLIPGLPNIKISQDNFISLLNILEKKKQEKEKTKKAYVDDIFRPSIEKTEEEKTKEYDEEINRILKEPIGDNNVTIKNGEIDDSKNKTRVPGEVREGQESIQARPIQEGGVQEVSPGGMVQETEVKTDEGTVDVLKDVESTTKALEGNKKELYKIPHLVEQEVSLEEINKIPKGLTFHERLSPDYYNELKNDISKKGIEEPVIIKYYAKDNAIRIQEGHHRIKIANELGIKNIPVKILIDWRNSIEDGNQDIKGQKKVSPPIEINKEEYRRRDYFPTNVNIEELGFKNKANEISEAYHKAKADGSNPKLVEAVENLLGKPKTKTDEGTVDLEAEEIEEQKPQGEESARWEQRVLSKLEEADKFTPEEEQKMRDISTEQAKTTAEFEGSSYDIDGKNMIGTENTSVSIFPEFTQTVDGEVTPEQIEAYRRQHDDLLRDNPDMVVGTWYDKKTGQTYLDISILVPNSNNEHVRTLANKYGQKAIFNLQDIKERDSYGHGEVMTMEESIEDRINEARQKDFTPEQKANFKKVNKAMDAADNIMKAVRSVDEKVNMTMHPTQSAFEKAYVKSALEGDKNLTPEQAMMDAKETKAFYDPNTKMIHIDLERFQTSDNDMMHEGVHPILNVINGINPKMIDTLYDQVVSMERRIGKRGLFKKGEVTEEFASQYDEDQQKMEAITEFIARVANNQYDLNNITVFAKIKDFFNNLLSSIGIGQKVRTEQELIDLANQIKEGFETGEEISLNEELFDNPDMANEFLQPGSLVDGTHKLQRSLIGKAKVKGFDTKPLTQREGMSYPKAENIEKVLEKSGGAAIFINSDATKVGEAIVNGRRIVIDGGIDYTYIKKNVDDGIGFAASDDAKIAILMNTAKQIVEKRDKLHPEHKGKPIAVFVTAQSGKAMLGEWYASEYIMEGLDIALSKGVYEGGLDAAKADFKKAILSVKLGKKEAGIFDERSKKKVVEMIDNGKFDTHEGRLEIARELASKDFSFGFRVNFNKVLIPLSNTISGSNQSIKKALYDSGHSLIDFWNKFMDERFLNYINEATTKNSDKSNAVGGKTISGFYYNHTTPIEEQFKHAKKGIQHAQFNSSFKSEGNFLLDAAYDVNEMFPEMAFPTERGIASYNKANKTNISKKNLTHNDKLDITNWLLENVDEDTLYKHKKNLIVKPYTSIAGSMYTGLTTKKHKIQPKKSKVNLLEGTDQNKYMTEDEKGNYVFYHYSNKDLRRGGINPKAQRTLATGKDENYMTPISHYYTEPDQQESMVSGNYKHMVRVPKDQVYLFDTDPLNLLPKAEAAFKKENPNTSFDANKQVAWVANEAAKKGYKMIVSSWGGGKKGGIKLRANAVESLKPELIQKPKLMGWGVETKPGTDYVANRKKKQKVQSKKRTANIPAKIEQEARRRMKEAVKTEGDIQSILYKGTEYIKSTDWFKKLSDEEQSKVKFEMFKTYSLLMNPTPMTEKEKKESKERGAFYKGVGEGIKEGKAEEKEAAKEREQKAFYQGIFEGIKKNIKDVKNVSKQLKEYLRKPSVVAKMNYRQYSALINEARNIDSQEKLEDFKNRVEEILAKNEEKEINKEKLAKANKNKSKIKNAVRSPKTFASDKGMLRSFGMLNPSKVEDIDTYNDIAEQILDKENRTISNEDVEKYIEEQTEYINENIRQKLLEDNDDLLELGIINDGMELDELRETLEGYKTTSISGIKQQEKLEERAERKAEKRKQIQELIDEKIKELKSTVDTDNLSDNKKEVIDAINNIDRTDLKDETLQLINRVIDNIIVNDSYSKAGDVVLIYRVQEAVKEYGFNLRELGIDSLENLLNADAKNIEKLFKNAQMKMFGTSHFLSATELHDKIKGLTRSVTGIQDLYTGHAKVIKRMKQFNDAMYSKQNKNNTSYESQIRQQMYSFMSQDFGGTQEDIDNDFKINKARLLESVKRSAINILETAFLNREISISKRDELVAKVKETSDIKSLSEELKNEIPKIKATDLKMLDTYSDIVQEANNPEDIRNKLNKDEQDIVDFFREEFASIKDDLFEISEMYGNEIPEFVNNYLPLVYNKMVGESNIKTEQSINEDLEANNFLGDIINKSPSGTTKLRNKGKGIKKGMILSTNFHYDMERKFRDALYQIHTLSARKTIPKVLGNTDFRDLYGKYNSDYLHNYAANAVKSQLNLADSDKSWLAVSSTISKIGTAGTRIALGSWAFGRINQMVNVQLGAWARMGAGGMAKVPSNPDENLFKYSNIEEAIITKSGFKQDYYVKDQQIQNEVYRLKRWYKQTVSSKDDFINWISDKTLSELGKGDAIARKNTWMRYYRKYRMERDGVKEINWDEEFKNPSKRASSYADQNIEETQSGNSFSALAPILTKKQNWGDFFKNMYLGYQTFAVAMRARLMVSSRKLRKGLANKDTELIHEAMKDISSVMVESSVFTTLKAAEGMLLILLVQQGFKLAGGDDDEAEELFKQLDYKDVLSRVGGGVFKDLFFTGIPLSDAPANEFLNWSWKSLTDSKRNIAYQKSTEDTNWWDSFGTYSPAIGAVYNVYKDIKALTAGVPDLEKGGLESKSKIGTRELSDNEAKVYYMLLLFDSAKIMGFSDQSISFMINKYRKAIEKSYDIGETKILFDPNKEKEVKRSRLSSGSLSGGGSLKSGSL